MHRRPRASIAFPVPPCSQSPFRTQLGPVAAGGGCDGPGGRGLGACGAHSVPAVDGPELGGGSEISPSGSHLLSLPQPPQHAPHHNEAANRRSGLEGAHLGPPIEWVHTERDARGAAARGTQWDTESRLRIKSSRLLITAGIPSGWLRSSAAPSHGQTAASGSESRAVSSRHPRGREHWDNWGPTGASSGMPSPAFQASSLPLLFALRGGHVPLSRHPWPSMRFLGASVPQLGAGGVCRHRALA